MAKKHILGLGLLGSSFLLAVLGCGTSRGDLSGKVSYKGQVLKSGSVNVLGSDGVSKGGAIQPDGTYLVQGIAAGDVKVSVTSPDPELSQPKQRKKDEPPPKVDRTGWFPIPEDYGDFEKSRLTFTLQSGSNTWDIELK
jgi:hypothetical protein